MSYFFAYLFVILFGSNGAHQTNINTNSLNEANESSYTGRSENHVRSFLDSNLYRSNDYDDYSSGVAEPRTPMHIPYPGPSYTDAKTPIKIYEPREDPRLYYQSDEYLKEVIGKSINYEVTNIYPGREVIRIGEKGLTKTIPAHRLKSRDDHRNDFAGNKHCIKCPRDRTVIAKAGYDRVALQSPRLLTCSGRKAPKNIKFAHYFGPKFGSLLKGGTYSIIGRIMNRNENLQMCKFKVHVVIQSCHTPPSLVAHCKGLNQPCTFTCRDSKMEIHGATSLTCGEDLQWDDYLPICKARNWCITPPPPDHGRISCTGQPAGKSHEGLAEGSRCRVRCEKGWRSNLRLVAFCRRGNWTRPLVCESKNSTRHNL
ncbi:E-selectin-like [Battus philenor]|uniref:E-selectin-like n=1 Tax=Battus philenor TaxID=42288 RepID=UPI0035CF1FA4